MGRALPMCCAAVVLLAASLRPRWRSGRLEQRGALELALVSSRAGSPRMSADADASPLHELLLSRRTVNAFEPELPAGWEAALERAVRAATFAPDRLPQSTPDERV